MQESSALDQVLLGCAPLVNRDREVAGLRLSVFPADPDVAVPATALLAEIDQALPAHLAVGDRADLPLIVCLAEAAMLDSALGLASAGRLVIEVPSFLAADTLRTASLRRAAQRGAALATSGAAVATLPADLMPCFKHVLADVADEQWGLPSSGAASASRLLVQGARTAEDVKRAFDSGALAVVGWPLEEVAHKSGAPANAELKGVLELMDLVERQAPLDDMERVLKGDPTLAFRLLRLINCAAFGLRVEVTSFRHALMLLGHMRLKRWLSLLLVSAARDPALRPVVHLAVRRAFLMEALAKALGRADEAEEMFVCGLFSLLDRLMQQPLSALLEQVPMPARVQVSLMDAAGPYGAFLQLMTAVEQSSMVDIREGAARLEISPSVLSRCTLGALASLAELGA